MVYIDTHRKQYCKMPRAPPLLLTVAAVLLSFATAIAERMKVVWEDGPADWPCGGVTYAFGVPVCVTKNARPGSTTKQEHILNTFYELLDNDEDGVADDPELVAKLIEKGSVLVVVTSDYDYNEFTTEYAPDWHTGKANIFRSAPNSCDVPTNREASATDRSTWPPVINTDGMSCSGLKDQATVGILRMLTDAAGELWPDIWGPTNTSLAGAALAAANANGTYFPPMEDCDQACVVADGVHWAIASYLGGLYTVESAQLSSESWLMATPDEGMIIEPPDLTGAISLEEGSPELYALVSDTTSEGHAWLPEVMPDGRYRSAAMMIASHAVKFSAAALLLLLL